MRSDYCDGIDRRGFLRMGSVAGLSLAQLLQLQQTHGAESSAQKKDVNCIFIFIIGGMAHQDMWDPKPEAPAEIRGDFRPIDTKVPGIQVSDLLPRIAGVTDKLAILRSLTHGDPDHTAGYHVMMTGQHPGFGGNFNRNVLNNNMHPSFGSMMAKLGGSSGTLPPYISVPNFLNSGGPSFLGPSYAHSSSKPIQRLRSFLFVTLYFRRESQVTAACDDKLRCGPSITSNAALMR